MKRSRRVAFCASAALVLFSRATLSIDLPPDLAQAVKDYDAAQINGDCGQLKRLLAEDYTLVNSSGATENKTELIADNTAPGYKLEPFVVREPIKIVWKNGAVMGGITTLRGTEAGKPFEASLRFSDIWAKRNGIWQVIYTHVSKPPK
jgi:ketosteroid isomerase-like protein